MTLKEESNFIQKIIGQEACDLFSCHLSLKDAELEKFLEEVNKEQKERLLESLAYFDLYCRNIGILRAAEKRSIVWPNFMLILLMSLIERVMNSDYVDLYQYIENKIKVGEAITVSILEEWKEKYGSTKSVRLFFKEYLEDKEGLICKHYKTVEFFIEEIIKKRNKFVHGLDISVYGEFGFSLKDSGCVDGKYEIEEKLSIDNIANLILKGVFRRFGYRGVL